MNIMITKASSKRSDKKFESKAYLSDVAEVSMKMETRTTGYLRLYGMFGCYESIILLNESIIDDITKESILITENKTQKKFIDLTKYIFDLSSGM